MVNNRIFDNIKIKIENAIIKPSFTALLDYALNPITEKLEKAFFDDFNQLKQRALAYGEYDKRYENNLEEKGLELELVKDHLMNELQSFKFDSPISEVDLQDYLTAGGGGHLSIMIDGKLCQLDLSKDEDKNLIRDRIGTKNMRILPGNPPRLSRPNFVNYLAAWTPDKQLNENDLEMLAQATGRCIVVQTADGQRKVFGTASSSTGDGNNPPLFMNHSEVDGVGHFEPLVQKADGSFEVVKGIHNQGNSCGIEAFLYATEREQALACGKTPEEADMIAKEKLRDQGTSRDIREDFISQVRAFAMASPNLRNVFLGRAHESGIVGGVKQDAYKDYLDREFFKTDMENGNIPKEFAWNIKFEDCDIDHHINETIKEYESNTDNDSETKKKVDEKIEKEEKTYQTAQEVSKKALDELNVLKNNPERKPDYEASLEKAKKEVERTTKAENKARDNLRDAQFKSHAFVKEELKKAENKLIAAEQELQQHLGDPAKVEAVSKAQKHLAVTVAKFRKFVSVHSRPKDLPASEKDENKAGGDGSKSKHHIYSEYRIFDGVDGLIWKIPGVSEQLTEELRGDLELFQRLKRRSDPDASIHQEHTFSRADVIKKINAFLDHPANINIKHKVGSLVHQDIKGQKTAKVTDVKVTRGLAYLARALTTNVRNLVSGPLPKLRRDDPGNDIDYAILPQREQSKLRRALRHHNKTFLDHITMLNAVSIHERYKVNWDGDAAAGFRAMPERRS
jgi:flagellar biosynthesis GTPase FlhF